jgi:hypothetical protein
MKSTYKHMSLMGVIHNFIKISLWKQAEILPVRGLYTIQNCSIYNDIHKKKTDSSKTI